jgi:integrase
VASINRRGDRYRVIWSVSDDGKRVQRVRTFATHAAARTFRAAMEAQEVRGIGGRSLPLGEHLDEWIWGKAREVEATTLAGYRRWVGHVQRHAIAKVPVDRVTPRDLDTLYATLSESPACRGKPLSAQSIRHVHTLLGNVFNDALRHRLIAENPCASAKPPRIGRRKVTAPNLEQVAAFIADLRQNNPGMVALAAVIGGTGLRRSEALGLRWQDVNLDAGRATVAQVVVEVAGEHFIRSGAKSADSLRTIALAPSIITLLRKQKAKVAALRLRLGKHWPDMDLVFPSPASGGPMAPATVTRAFRRAADRAGWPAGAAAVHGLRHAAASLAVAGGTDIATVSRRLGHASVATTARLYLHPQEELDQAAADGMAARLGLA